MSESSDPARLVASEPDATGYRRPLLGPDDPRRDVSPEDRLDPAKPRASSMRGAFAPEQGIDRDEAPAPTFCDRRLATRTILAFWTFYFVLAGLRALLMGQDYQLEMAARRAVLMVLAIALTWLIYGALLLARRASFNAKLVAAAVCCLPAAVIFAYANHYAFDIIAPGGSNWTGGAPMSLANGVVERAFSQYFLFAAWSAFFVALSYARDLRLADARAAALAREAQDAQLRALRYQINPHFLFNTLNSLSSLVLAKRNETAEQMLLNLSRFFRTTLTAEPTADVTLGEEIEMQQLYLEIEQIRFPDRLKVEIDVPEPLARRRVPVLILQPIVENAVKYGVARSRSVVTIRITAVAEAGRLHITVRNDGDARPAHAGDADGTGVGLGNVAARLKARFGARADLIHGPDPDGGYTAHVFLPAARDD